MERYDPNIPLPESGNMRDIPKWRSQKATWVPFIVSLDMSVWTVLQDVLTADSAKELCLQKTPTRDEPKQNITPKSNEETGTVGVLSIFPCTSPSPLLLYQKVKKVATTLLLGMSKVLSKSLIPHKATSLASFS